MIGPYISGPLTVDSSGSPIQLSGLILKSDIIERFSDDTPLTIKAGYIGQILIHLPSISDIIYRPAQNPVEIEIREFRLLLNETEGSTGINAEYGRKRETALQDYKLKILEHMEKTFQNMGISGIESEEGSQANSGWMWNLTQNMMAKKDVLMTNILSNIKFKLADIHIRVEIEDTYYCGVKIQELEGRNTNEAWSPIEDKSSTEKDNFKLVEMKDLSAYWHESGDKDTQANQNLDSLEEIRGYFDSMQTCENNLIDPVYSELLKQGQTG